MVLVSFLSILALGVPVAYVLVITALIYILLSGNEVLLLSFPQQFFGGLENYGLLALPLFILVGEFMNEGGIARRLIAMAAAFIGPVRGGLAYVNLLANMMMASILGSTVAQITIMTRMAVPEMERAGYSKDMAVAITAAGGLLSPIIPPSMLFVVFGVIAQISIGDLFIAGIIPGLLLSASFFGVLYWLGIKHGFPRIKAATPSERLGAIRDGLPAALIPLTIIGSILGGIATPTEAAALAAVAALLVGRFVYRDLDLRQIGPAFLRTARNSAIVLVLIAAAQVFGWVITYENLPALVAGWLQSVSDSPLVFLLLVNAVLLVIGMVIDPLAALILIVPVLLPIATDVYALNPFHFGVIVCLNLVLGLLTPPVGSGLFTAAVMSGVKAERLAWVALPFLVATALVLLLLILVPQLVVGLL
ncbi:TRAP transporter large permease [Telmatospirillum sp. J64-1]|uniref:TRAP transporter large permease n=1 Tax=Telmatospirillum sp. J64-1 TaxID=2502183 RepID=UPI002106E2AE|nr:TRAP transporter large permease [Telmatospirillum sp. J64-1]